MINPQPATPGHGKTNVTIIATATIFVLVITAVFEELIRHGAISLIIETFWMDPWEYGKEFLEILCVLVLIIILGGSIVYVFSLGLRSTISELSSSTKELSAQIENLRTQHDIIGGKVLELETINQEMRPGVADVRRFINIAPLAAGDRVELLQTDLIMRPDEYCERIRSMRTSQTPPARLTFMGSMVGFTYTLAQQLGKFVAETRASLDEITYIGPNCTTPGATDSNLIWTVWNFQLTILRTFLTHLLDFEYTTKDWNLTFFSHYMPFDILSAAIFVPDEYVVVLQALSVEMLELVAKRKEHLIGMKYSRNDAKSAVYGRYDHAISSYKKYPNVVHDKVEITYSESDGGLTIRAHGISLPIDVVRNRFINLEYLAKLAAGQESNDQKTLTFPRETQNENIGALIKDLSNGLEIIERKSNEVRMLNNICKEAGPLFG